MAGRLDDRPGARSGGVAFALFGLLLGLAAGAGAHAIAKYWISDSATTPVAVVALHSVFVFAAAWLLLADRGKTLVALLPAAAITAILAWPAWHMGSATLADAYLDRFPLTFWALVAGPLTLYLLITLGKSVMTGGFPPHYSNVFLHGLTLPLIAGGAKIFMILSFVLLFAWAYLLKSMNVDFFHRVFQDEAFFMPVSGAIVGLSIALMRGLEAVLSTLRYILVLFCRIAMPITAAFSLTFLAVLLLNGTQAVFALPYPGHIMLGLAFAGMLIFNGVYQNGEGGPPPAWLRLATFVSLAIFPVYAGLAAWSLWERIGDFGLTPARVAGLAVSGLAASYSIVCLLGLLSELNWRSRRWMPPVAPLNTLMACVWILILWALATPLADPWALSARNQEERLLAGKVAPEEFDFLYLRYCLGPHGHDALDRLAQESAHPEAGLIRDGAERARAAEGGRRCYIDLYPVYEETHQEPSADAPSAGPMALEFNPADAPAEEEGASAPTPREPER